MAAPYINDTYHKLKHANSKSPCRINHAAGGVIPDASTPCEDLDRLKQQINQVKRIYGKQQKKH
jgi:hypothetical protein